VYVRRRTVGTGITIAASDMSIDVRLVGIDWLGACALLHVARNGAAQPGTVEMGPGETIYDLHPDVEFKLLRLAYATHGGTPARVAEFGISAPKAIRIWRMEQVG